MLALKLWVQLKVVLSTWGCSAGGTASSHCLLSTVDVELAHVRLMFIVQLSDGGMLLQPADCK